MSKIRYIRNIDQVKGLTGRERVELAKVSSKYAFRANEYYLGLINWHDPDDPIRRIVIPHISELDDFGELDASREEANYVAPGCQHKYADTALLLCNEVCSSYCRFCFRKRLFMNDNDEAALDITAGLKYIADHPQITNVLLSGGDPLLLSTRRLSNILSRIRAVDHVGIIRIGTKIPAFNPHRILNDPDLLDVLAEHSTKEKRIYMMVHFNVPGELTEKAVEALDLLKSAGTVVVNQTPLLRGINDKPEVLAELMRKLSFMGVAPYYFFQCRPTRGNKPYQLTIIEAHRALSHARKKVSGLAKRARLVMSHSSGKVEILGATRKHIYARYHRAKHEADAERFMIFHRDDTACWLDDLIPADRTVYGESRFSADQHRGYGPE